MMTIIMTVVMIMIMIMMVMSMTMMSRRCCYGSGEQVAVVCRAGYGPSTNNHEPTPPHPTYGLVWDSLAGGHEHGIQFRVDCIYA